MNKQNLQIMLACLALCQQTTLTSKQQDMRSPGSQNNPINHDSFFDDVQSLHNDFFGNNFFGAMRTPSADHSTDMFESDGNIIVEMNAPGLQESDIEIEVINDSTLSISGVRKSNTKSDSNNYYKQEISYGRFQKMLKLPAQVDEDAITAEVDNGVLRITLPVKDAVKPKTKKVTVTKKNK